MSLFPALACRCSNPPKIWKAARGDILPPALFTKALYPLGSAGGRDEIMEKYGVGNFIVAFADICFCPAPAASKAAEEITCLQATAA